MTESKTKTKQAAAKPATKAASTKPKSAASAKTVAKPAAKTAVKAVKKPVEKAAAPAKKATAKPATKAAAKPVTKPAAKTAAKPAEKPKASAKAKTSAVTPAKKVPAKAVAAKKPATKADKPVKVAGAPAKPVAASKASATSPKKPTVAARKSVASKAAVAEKAPAAAKATAATKASVAKKTPAVAKTTAVKKAAPEKAAPKSAAPKSVAEKPVKKKAVSKKAPDPTPAPEIPKEAESPKETVAGAAITFSAVQEPPEHLTLRVENNRVVAFHYRLREVRPDGSFSPWLEESFGRQPLLYLHGHGNVIPGLEQALQGKKAGDAINIKLPPELAYGHRTSNEVQRIPIKHLYGSPNPKNLVPGAVVSVKTNRGVRNAMVLKAGKFNVDLDTNHPYAGRTLHYQIEILGVRHASPEEVAHRHVHGPGGHQH